jgi:uncharacterized protein YbbK (DUF523 family)
MKLVSACLLGINCNYKGNNSLNEKLLEEFKKGELFPVCPEILGCQSIPRKDAQIKGGSGNDVINGSAKVVEPDGNDVTCQFIDGAKKVVEIAKTLNVKEAILKARSPSCGCGKIYDGTFSRTLIDGDGVTSALLKRNGIKVISNEEI